MSIPAVKGVELGMGFEAARRKGSEVHDRSGRVVSPGRRTTSRRSRAIMRAGFRRATNRAGGTEGGMTTGEPLVARVAMKPISTLMSPLRTVDLNTGGPAQAQTERSDVTAVAAMGVIAETMVALMLAEAMLEKFGGDALAEMKRNFDGYSRSVGARWNALRAAGVERAEAAYRADRSSRLGENDRRRAGRGAVARGVRRYRRLLMRREGKPVTMIFAEQGEAAFRDLERRRDGDGAAREPAVIAPGGGWAAQTGALDGAKPRAMVIYLLHPPNGGAARRA